MFAVLISSKANAWTDENGNNCYADNSCAYAACPRITCFDKNGNQSRYEFYHFKDAYSQPVGVRVSISYNPETDEWSYKDNETNEYVKMNNMWFTQNYKHEDGYATSDTWTYYNEDGTIDYVALNSDCQSTGRNTGLTTDCATHEVFRYRDYKEDGSYNVYDDSGNLIRAYNGDGSYTLYDENGSKVRNYNADGSVYVPPSRRIYTVPEAVDATGKKKRNSFSIRHR